VTAELETLMNEVDSGLPADATAFDRAHLLAARFEGLLAPGSVKRKGAVYTPRFIADRVVSDSLELWRENGGGGRPRLCDPACGSGVFLVAAAECLCVEFGMSVVEALSSHVRGLDVAPDAQHFARSTLEALARWSGAPNARAQEVAAAAVVGLDALLTPVEELRGLVFGSGPDIVVGNPPYVKLQNLDVPLRERLLEAYAGFASGSFSLSSLFLVRCLDLVGSGVCGLITQNNLFTSMAGRPVRRLLKERGALLKIVDFNHRKVFRGASAYTCLLYTGGSGGHEFLYTAVHDDDIEAALCGLDWSVIALSELGPGKWRLGSRAELDNVRVIEAAGLPLRDLCHIHVGFATLYDRAFVVEHVDGAWFGRGPDGELRPVEVGLTRAFYKVSELDRAPDLDAARRRILFPYLGQPGAWTLLAWEGLQREWPGAAAHLLAWRDALLARDKGKGRQDQWYAWGRRQSFDAPGPKLLTPTFNRAPGFVLDPSDALFCNGYSVAPRPGAPLTAAGLGTLLNSRVMHYYACATSFHIHGGYQCYQKNFIETFTVPPLTPALRDALEAGHNGLDESIAQAYGVDMADVERLLSRYHGSGVRAS
jgi:adenine-specific DNA-methyltransferase